LSIPSYHNYLNDIEDEVLQNRFNIKNIKGLASQCDFIVCDGKVSRASSFKNKNVQTCTVYIALKNSLAALCLFEKKLMPLIIKKKIYIVLGCTDATFPSQTDMRYPKPTAAQLKMYYSVLQHESVKRCYSTNLDTVLPFIKPIPIGLATEFSKSSSKFSFYSQFEKGSDILSRPLMIGVFDRVRNGKGQWADRLHVRNMCLTKWQKITKVHTKEKTHRQFLEAMTQYPFVICTHGGGIDPCPKAWEALLCGAIPIVYDYPSLRGAYSMLPVMYVNNWDNNDLSHARLKSELDKLHKYFTNLELRATVLYRLSLKFWWEKINEAPK
jgi:hypothetical protein